VEDSREDQSRRHDGQEHLYGLAQSGRGRAHRRQEWPHGAGAPYRPCIPLYKRDGDAGDDDLSGHASVAITLDTYSHKLPGMGGEAATAIEDVLSQGASKVTPTRSSGVREAASPMHGRLAEGPSVTPGS
jgi:hypothetical protein